MEEPLKRFSSFVETHRLVADGNILLAVSGGVDSVAMAHLFAEYRRRHRPRLSLFVCYVHHHLRREAEHDVEIVRAVSESIDAPFILRHLTPPERPTEAWARVARYGALFSVARKLGCLRVATAHTADDQAETIIMRAIRGVGLNGLKGILVKSSPVPGITLIRPLLNFRKSELRRYVQSRGLPFVVDRSNYDLSILRNRIRHRLLPLLEREYRQGSVEALSRLALAVQTMPMPEIEPLERRFFGFREAFIGKEDVERYPYLLHKALQKAAGIISAGRVNIPQWLVFKVLQRLLAGDRLRISLVSDVLMEVGDEGVVLYRRTAPKADEVHLPLSGSVAFCGVEFSVDVFMRGDIDVDMKGRSRFVEFFDADRVGSSILVRRIKRGDRFVPLGMKESCKVFRFLLNSGVVRRIREYVPLILSESRDCIWVVPFRIDARFALTERTQRVLRIEVSSDVAWVL